MPIRVRLVTLFLLVSLFVSGSLFGVTPHKAEAQVSGVGGIIASCSGLSGLIQGALSSVIGYVPVNDPQNNGKECMDAVAYALAKTVLAQLTNSIINWINTGFQGNPFYLTDSRQFFQDIAGGQARLVLSEIQASGNAFFDSIRAQTIGRFRYGFQNRFSTTFNQDARQALCSDENDQSEFYVEVVRVPGRSIEGPFQTYAACNARRGAAENEQGVTEVGFCTQTGYPICASNLSDSEWSQAYGSQGFIDQFTSGQIPFRWDLFNSLTQNCGNNPFCSRYAAQSAIQNQIAQRGNQVAQELNRSGGFLGQQRCVDGSYEDRLADWESQLADPANANNPEVIAAIGYRPECPGYVTETPGRIIADKLTGSLGTAERQLELADEINESLAAIFDALIAKLIDEGLSSFNGSGSDDYYNFLNDPRSGFGFGTTFDQINNDNDCEDLGGQYNPITNTCEFPDDGNNQLPSFPWFIDGVPYNTIEDIIEAFPGRCVLIDGIEIIPGIPPCLEGVSSDDGGPVDDYRGTLILSSNSGVAGTPITIEIRNAKPNAPAEVAQSEGLIGIGTTNASGSFSISFTPTGNPRPLTIYGEVEDTVIPPAQFNVTGSTGGGGQYQGSVTFSTNPVPSGGSTNLVVSGAQPNTAISFPSLPPSILIQSAQGVTTNASGGYAATLFVTSITAAQIVNATPSVQNTNFSQVNLTIQAGSGGGQATTTPQMSFAPSQNGWGGMTGVIAITGLQPNASVSLQSAHTDGSPFPPFQTISGQADSRGNYTMPIVLLSGVRSFTITGSSGSTTLSPVSVTMSSTIAFSSTGRATTTPNNPSIGQPVSIQITNARQNQQAAVVIIRPDNTVRTFTGTTDATGTATISLGSFTDAGTYAAYPSVEGTLAISRVLFTVGSSGSPSGITWYDVSGVGNYGESCDAWLTRTGQKRNVTQGYMNDREVNQTLPMFGGCAYESGSLCGVGSIFSSSTQYSLRPVASCDVSNPGSNINVKTQVASSSISVQTYPFLENNWRNATGEGNVGESCSSWLTRTGQMTSGTLLRVIYLGLMVTELDRCIYKREFNEEYGEWNIEYSHPLFKPVSAATGGTLLRLQLK